MMPSALVGITIVLEEHIASVLWRNEAVGSSETSIGLYRKTMVWIITTEKRQITWLVIMRTLILKYIVFWGFVAPRVEGCVADIS